MRQEQIAAVLATLARTPAIVISLVREMDPALVKRRPRPSKWSVHEHACHLVVIQPIFVRRLERMLTEAHPRIEPYFPEQAHEDGALLQVDLDEALARFDRERARLVERLRQLGSAEWDRTAEHGEYSRYSVFVMFRHLAMH